MNSAQNPSQNHSQNPSQNPSSSSLPGILTNPLATHEARIVLERTYHATVDEIWTLWTTKDGMEAWWGPDGFRVNIKSLDLRPEGKVVYGMEAVLPEMIEFMKQNGMPTETITTHTYTEVERFKRLGWRALIDFVPGVSPYEVNYLLELFPSQSGVLMRLTFDRMHDALWTERATTGQELEFNKLEALLKARHAQA